MQMVEKVIQIFGVDSAVYNHTHTTILVECFYSKWFNIMYFGGVGDGVRMDTTISPKFLSAIIHNGIRNRVD
ncbi:hypothetical protein HanXRQr2_Chr16g0775981 [Helianthus annuus]|uniref:Uncharacterized protein n=2 Tax=Helianthus annuus TaxID=4232 RepID=A0A9K3DVW8_HELAN|nr:hypothetical protein HanXRQr2_Chr16g0775981 [Helianthus annuus]KAJ0440111.1 hypothetical protein HanHA300_Chr16g0632801 [Helianthus annuus]KAJ0445409.1 hypothetical protein HanIR_Chr16g0842571 [Helianthus annuus]KAJ0462492.1 hypothetical protein HanHA89_Chr16g0683971 [Helianthus annuus]KAJ0642892.1 hypothetical protein HanLR1_Chr16g0643381 [Helianthus annuus]